MLSPFGIIRNILGKLIINTEFSLLCELENTGGSELLGDRSDAVFRCVGIRDIQFHVGHSKCFLVDGYAFVENHYRAIKFPDTGFGNHVFVDQLLVILLCM